MALIKYHTINSGQNGYTGMVRQGISEVNELRIFHNAGFFSCSSIALLDIMVYFNENKSMPDKVNRYYQYEWYKEKPTQSLIAHFFAETDIPIHYEVRTEMTYAKEEPQYSDYSYINFEGVKPFVDKFFAPSQYILDKVKHLEEKYQIDYNNTVGILYRSNDKHRETNLPTHEDMIKQARYVSGEFYLIAPDETEFLTAFSNEFPTLCMEETQHMPKKDSAVFLELPLEERAEQACNFFALVIMLSKCKQLITHSGNIGFWACLYRGNVKGVSQYLKGSWINH